MAELDGLNDLFGKTEVKIQDTKKEDWVEIYLNFDQDLENVEILCVGEIGEKTFSASKKYKKELLKK